MAFLAIYYTSITECELYFPLSHSHPLMNSCEDFVSRIGK